MKNRALFLLGIIYLISIKINAQVLKADFTANTTKGCSPVTVVFTNLSSPSSGLTYFWDFGNGATSVASNPIILFTEPGHFDIKLIVSNGISKDTITKKAYITVFKKPAPNFKINSEQYGCAPYKTEFQNQTLLGDTIISIWHWDFGDGFISSLENPSHTFQYQDSYSVSLYVKDKNRCDNLIVYDKYISVYKPVSSFDCTNSVSCSGILQTSFANKSTGIGALSYLWNFGNNSVSTDKDPHTTYTVDGLYDVSLITTDEHSCSDTLVRKELISVEKLNASFIVNRDTACTNENIVFTNTSSKIFKCNWDFGDGSYSELTNPSHSYASSGNYTVKLTVTAEKGCSNVFSKMINVEKVVADYTSSQSFSCESQVQVNYTDKSINASIWDWRFGDNTKSILKNPTNTYTKAGIYIDTLIITSTHGCKNMKVVNPGLTIVQPRAYFTPNNWVEVSNLKGCTPLTVNFNDNSIYATDQDYINSWQWDFGDGTYSSSKNPSHVFQGTATYQMSLKITTSKGCVSYYSAMALTGTRQNADFIKDQPDVICASSPVQFTDISENRNLINEWYWLFGDGGHSTAQNPSHIFTDTGYMEVKLIVAYNGCPDNEIKPKFIYVKGPIVNPDYTINCAYPLVANLKSNAISASKLYWNYGDGSAIDSSQINPNHVYNSRGEYNLNLKAINNLNGCTYETKKVIQIRNIKAVISPDKVVGCPGAIITFNPQNSIDQYNFQYNGITGKYLWNFGDGTEVMNSTFPFSHQFNSKGIYNVKLKVKDFRGCADSVIQEIKIYKPEPTYLADNFVGCMPMSVDFKDKTISDTTITNWLWEFGDNTVSTEKNPVHIYVKHGLYNVSLTVTDQLGCSSKLSNANYIEALKPFPDFKVSDRTICVGDTIAFTCLAKDSIHSYLWNFGDGTSSILPKPSHTYSHTGAYNISLQLIDRQGCDSIKTMMNYIDLQESPNPDFDEDNTFTNCFPLAVHFTDKSAGNNIAHWDWSFEENQSSAQIQNPVHTYTKPGIYDVSLKATTSYGCTKSIIKKDLIEIRGPWAKINAPKTICKNSPIKLIATDKINVNDMQWFFNDGTVGFGDTVFHVYKNPGIIIPSLLLMTDDMHTCDKYFVDTLFMDVLKASIFEYEHGQSGCVPFTKSFTDQSIGAKYFSWNFGEGSISSEQNPMHLYQNDGQFKSRLIVSNSFGCTDTSYSNITVFPLPNVKLIKDTLVCRGQRIELKAIGAISYSWSPNQYLNIDNISNPISTPEKTLDYQVMGIDTNGCINYSNMKLAVQQKPVITVPDTTVIIGEVVKMNAYANDLLSYSWTPSYALTNTSNAIVYAQPLETTKYELTVVDTNKCFTVTKEISIQIRKEYTVDVPSAFTPNGDGINDKIYVKGWGVKDVIDFKILNRFNELVFESHDKNDGWDGVYRGNNQNIETYTYYVKIRTYEDEIMEKTGTIKLLK